MKEMDPRRVATKLDAAKASARLEDVYTLQRASTSEPENVIPRRIVGAPRCKRTRMYKAGNCAERDGAT